jgi:hypothetical protein
VGVNSNLNIRRSLGAKAEDGRAFQVTVGIAVPYTRPDGSWAVSFIVDPLQSNLSEAFGMDSWQATTLAMKAVKSVLRHFVRNGGLLFLNGESGPFTEAEIDEYF